MTGRVTGASLSLTPIHKPYTSRVGAVLRIRPMTQEQLSSPWPPQAWPMAVGSSPGRFANGVLQVVLPHMTGARRSGERAHTGR